jgi:hypothetical protein
VRAGQARGNVPAIGLLFGVGEAGAAVRVVALEAAARPRYDTR